jgi:polar amino acid transport system substrate-binding protein
MLLLALTIAQPLAAFAAEGAASAPVGPAPAGPGPSLTSELTWEDFIGTRIGVMEGTIYDAISRDRFQASQTLYFQDDPTLFTAVAQGKVDCILVNSATGTLKLSDPAFANLAMTIAPAEVLQESIACVTTEQWIVDAYAGFLAQIEADGTLEDMKRRWVDEFDRNAMEMPKIDLVATNGTLTVAVDASEEPFTYHGAGGELLGLEIEHMRRFAQYLGMDVRFDDMAFSGIIAYVNSGKADIGAADFAITEERRKSIMFTEPYNSLYMAIVYPKANYSSGATSDEPSGAIAQPQGPIGWLANAIERNLITEGRWMLLAEGLGTTMQIALLAQLLGTALGCLVCFLLTRPSRIASVVAKVYTWFIHGLPMVVLLLITYYIIFGSTNIPGVLVAVAAFTLVEGAAIGGTLKGAIDTVDPVQIEAARSLGYSKTQAFFTVTLPQAVKHALPGYTNGFIELIKGTAIVGYIAIQDLSRSGDIIRSRTYDAFFPLLFVGVVYLIITSLCVLIFKLLLKRTGVLQ